MSAVDEWDVLVFTRCFYPCVTISAAQACKSDDIHHAKSPFSFLGICEATKDRSGASSRNREKKEHLEEPSDWDRLHAAL